MYLKAGILCFRCFNFNLIVCFTFYVKSLHLDIVSLTIFCIIEV